MTVRRHQTLASVRCLKKHSTHVFALCVIQTAVVIHQDYDEDLKSFRRDSEQACFQSRIALNLFMK